MADYAEVGQRLEFLERRAHLGVFGEVQRSRCTVGRNPSPVEDGYVEDDRKEKSLGAGLRRKTPLLLSVVIHHATFDHFLLGVTPDGLIEVRSDLLSEKDGPML